MFVMENVFNKIKNAYISNLRIDDHEFNKTINDKKVFEDIFYNVCKPYDYIESKIKKKLLKNKIDNKTFCVLFDVNRFIFDCNWVILFWKNKYKQILKKNNELEEEIYQLKRLEKILKK